MFIRTITGLLVLALGVSVRAEARESCKTFPMQDAERVYAETAPDDFEPGTDSPFEIVLFASTGRPVNDAEVKFTSTEGRERILKVRPGAGSVRPDGEELPPGRYTVRAFDAQTGNVSPARSVTLPLDHDLRMGVSRTAVPFFRLQDTLVPFDPSRVIGISFEFDRQDPQATQALKRLLFEKLHATEVELKDIPESTAHSGELLLVQMPDGVDHLAPFIGQVRKLAPDSARVGVLIDRSSGSVKLLDNQFVLRLKAPHLEQELSSFGIRVLRHVRNASPLLHVQLPTDDYLRNLSLLECLIEAEYIDIAEPDLVMQIHDHALPMPNDPRYTSEQGSPATQFGRQQFLEAWTQLHAAQQAPIIGDADVHVAVLEHDISSAPEEFNCKDSAGSPQISQCWDAGISAPCSQTPPSGPHGFSVLGILAACVSNHREIAGMAPGVSKTIVKFTKYPSALGYADLLRWTAGFPVACPAVGNSPKHPCHWPTTYARASVINNSYGICGAVDNGVCSGSFMPLPTAIADAFTEQVTHGRITNGVALGTVLVYSAGNEARSDLITSPFARDKRTIGVSNCMIDGQEERLTKIADESQLGGWGSNFGPQISLCALGHRAPTVETTGCFRNSAGNCIFGATSAAAPQVSAGASLVLSANLGLAWKEVRKVLRMTSDPINNSPTVNFGRLNACAAVSTALSLAGKPYKRCN